MVFIFALLLVCCGDFRFSGYVLTLPKAPDAWISLLGQPCWRIEWLDVNGKKQTADLLPGESAEIEPPLTWASPVAALPYWPEHNLAPGVFKPAGALFPFDVSGRKIKLCWEAGTDAVFYWELAVANADKPAKRPANFNWPRFRELFKNEELDAETLKDPWLIDWRSVAEKTISSSFDKRRLVPETAVSLNIPVPAGNWYGTSPFADPLFFPEGETPVFPIRSGVNVWVSGKGILRISGKTWIFTER